MSNLQESNLDTSHSTLLPAIIKLMRPLVKLMLHYQITYPQCAAGLKGAFVDVAEDSFKDEKISQTDSRVSFLTGINRKEVKRLRSSSDSDAYPTETASARIFARWLACDSDKSEPRQLLPLPLQGKQSPTRNFNAFVGAECRSDIRPKVVLDEWLRQGLVAVEDNLLTLNPEAFSPKQGFSEKALFFGSNIGDHIEASSHNLMGYKPSFFDRSVYCDGLTNSSIEELESYARELGMEALVKMNARARQLQAADQPQVDSKFRYKFGVFSFHHDGSQTHSEQQ